MNQRDKSQERWGCEMSDSANMFEPLASTKTDTDPPSARDTLGASDDRAIFTRIVPTDAPSPTPLKGCLRWIYRDEDGHESHYVDRYDPKQEGGRKAFVPLTLWRLADGSYEWRQKHPPKPRSLYNLDGITSRKDLPIIVCEGEKAADAAGIVFNDHVATTSSGGANAASMTDWSPCRGRIVIIWPDNDQAGRAYASDVERLVTAAGAANVRLVEIPQGWIEGWDFADDLPDGKTWDDVRRLLTSWKEMNGSSCSLPAQVGSVSSQGSVPVNLLKENGNSWNTEEEHFSSSEGSDWLPPGFQRDDNGNILLQIKKKEPIWLCSPIEIDAVTRNSDGQAWGRLIRVKDRDGQWHEWAMPMSTLAGSGETCRARLLDLGLDLAPGGLARKALQILLTSAEPVARATCVNSYGWHGEKYILPRAVFGEQDSERIVVQTTAPLAHSFRTAGTLSEWQQVIGTYAVGNSRLAFALSAAVAGPLLRIVGSDGGGFHFRGISSSGKTTLLEVAGSVCGGGPNGYKRSWRATDNALEGVAALHNDGLLVLDEIGEITAEGLRKSAYLLANGQPKQRMSRDAVLRPAEPFRILFLSTGEVSLADKILEFKHPGRVMAGQEIRVIDIPADAGAGCGVFDELGPFASGQAFADHLKRAAQFNYGQPLRAFLARLVGDPIRYDLRDRVDAFVSNVVPKDADGQVRRVAFRFGLAAVAGELASAFEVFNWPNGTSYDSAARLFNEWVTKRGGKGPAEIEDGINALRHFLEQHGASRFAPWNAASNSVANRCGYVKEENGCPTYFIFPLAWRQEILAGHDATLIMKALVERGHLRTEKSGKPQKKERLPNGYQGRFYIVLPSLFEDA